MKKGRLALAALAAGAGVSAMRLALAALAAGAGDIVTLHTAAA